MFKRKDHLATPPPFTWHAYDLCLQAALQTGYRFLGFPQVAGSALPEERCILLRHDIDYEPRWALPISSIEAQRDIRATYFFQADSKFYSLKSRDARAVVEQVLGHGHWVGLHFDATGIANDQEVLARVEQQARALEQDFGTPVEAVSFHMPSYRPVGHLQLKNGRVNTYAPVFFEKIEYVSDSNQDWRDKNLVDMFHSGKYWHIQLLTHPIWWRKEYSTLGVKMQELADQRRVAVADIVTAEQQALLDKVRAGER